MADKVFPASKPPGAAAPPTTTNGGATFPANKAQLYNTTRPAYRPTPYHDRRRRSCWCRCCLWTTLLIIVLLLLLGICGAIFYVIYRPHRPSFAVSGLQISQFNVSSSSLLTSKFNLNITARNPNKKLSLYYNPINVLITSSGANVGAGSIPAFTQGKKNTTTLRTVVTTSSQSVDKESLKLNNNKGLKLKIQLDTKVKLKIAGVKTKNIGIRVKCDGIQASVPTGKLATMASTKNVKCDMDLRIKIWKWTF